MIRWPEPIPPIEKIRACYKTYESSLKIAVSSDGKVACHRYLTKVIELHEQHLARGLIAESVGTEQNKHKVTYSFDAFPVDGISIEHGVISSSSLVVASQSEDMCKIILVSTMKENTLGLNRMHEARRIDKDYNLIWSRGYVKNGDRINSPKIFIEQFICVDKKAVEMLRGCSPGCPWCECTPDSRLATAWPITTPPTSWKAALALLDKVCRHAFPTAFDQYAWAHRALPFEQLPRRCKFCKKLPYATVEEYKADLEKIEKERSDPDKIARAAFQRKRSVHAAAHARQYLHETSNLMVDMDHVITEVMHLVELNAAKQCWTKGVVLLMSAYMREISTGFFTGMGFKLDVKLKANGQSGSAWFKASVINELVHGSAKVPGGLAPWMASLLFFVGEDHLAKQTRLLEPVSGQAQDDPPRIVLNNRYGVKGQQLFNTAKLWDSYKTWHDTTFMPTPNEAEREAVALRMAVAANELTSWFKVVAKESGKTWIFHIALYISTRQVARSSIQMPHALDCVCCANSLLCCA